MREIFDVISLVGTTSQKRENPLQCTNMQKTSKLEVERITECVYLNYILLESSSVPERSKNPERNTHLWFHTMSLNRRRISENSWCQCF